MELKEIEQTLDWLYRLKSNAKVYLPKQWVIAAENALGTAIKSFKTAAEKRFFIHEDGSITEINAKHNTHELKILPQWFDDVQSGKKNFEIRKADREFKVGDYLILGEWYRGKYTGRTIIRQIEYIYQGDGSFGISEEYCILGIKNPKGGTE